MEINDKKLEIQNLTEQKTKYLKSGCFNYAYYIHAIVKSRKNTLPALVCLCHLCFTQVISVFHRSFLFSTGHLCFTQVIYVKYDQDLPP